MNIFYLCIMLFLFFYYNDFDVILFCIFIIYLYKVYLIFKVIVFVYIVDKIM